MYPRDRQMEKNEADSWVQPWIFRSISKPGYLVPFVVIFYHKGECCLIRIKIAIYCPQGSGMLRQQLPILHYLALSCTILHYLALYCTILHYLALSWTILHYLTPSCTMLHHLAPCCSMLHHLAQGCTRLYHLAPSCTNLQLALCCTILHYVALSCTILQWYPVVPIRYTCSQHMSPVIAFI